MRQGFILASANKEERFVAVKGPFCMSCNQRAPTSRIAPWYGVRDAYESLEESGVRLHWFQVTPVIKAS